MFGNNERTATISVVGMEDDVDRIVYNLVSGSEPEWFLREGLSYLMGNTYYGWITLADLAALAEIAGSLKGKMYGIKIGVILASEFRRRLKDRVELCTTEEGLPDVITYADMAATQLKETMFAFRRLPEFDVVHPIYKYLGDGLDETNKILMTISETEQDRKAIRDAKELIETIEDDAEKTIAKLLEAKEKAVSGLVQVINNREDFVDQAIRGEICSCSVCRFNQERQEMARELARTKKELVKELKTELVRAFPNEDERSVAEGFIRSLGIEFEDDGEEESCGCGDDTEIFGAGNDLLDEIPDELKELMRGSKVIVVGPGEDPRRKIAEALGIDFDRMHRH